MNKKLISYRPASLAPATWTMTIAALLLTTLQARADDLAQIYGDARMHDASLQSALAQLQSAEPRAAQAQALFLPNISAAGTSSQTQTRLQSDELDPSGAHVHTLSSSLSVNLRQTVFNRASSVDVSKARVAVDMAKAEYEITLQAFIVRVAQTYFDVLSAQDVWVAARQSKLSIEAQLTSAQRNFDAGTGIVTDVQDAQARFDLARSQELAADNDLRISSLALARLVGRRGAMPDRLAMPVVLPTSISGEVDAWVADSAMNPSVGRARFALDLARLDTARAHSGHSPTLDLVSSVMASRSAGSGAGLTGDRVPGSSASTMVGLELNVPLFAGNAVQNKIRETSILEMKAEDDLEAAQRAAAEATERGFFQLQTAAAQVKALEAAELSGQQSLEGTQMGYQAGVRVSLDVLNAQSLLFQTRRDLAKARYDVLMDYLKLRQAAGKLKEEDIADINRFVVR